MAEYDNSFSVITVFDKVKYIYQLYEGKALPVITPMHEEPTEESNGTEIRIPVLAKDIQRFEQEMVKQLYYFENIIFEGFNTETLKNDYQIFQGENFLYRGSECYSNIHVCLGRVAYPIDYAVLGLDQNDYNIPVALRLNVGDANVTVSRENLDYNESTIKLLKQKLIDVKAELTQMIVHQYDNIIGLEDYFNFKNNFGGLKIGDKTLKLGKLVTAKDIALTNFKYKDLPTLDSNKLFKIFFNVRMFGAKEKKVTYYNNRNEGDTYYFNKNYDGIFKCKSLYTCEGLLEIKRMKQSWLKSQHNRYYIVQKVNFIQNDLSDVEDDKGISLFNTNLWDDVNLRPNAFGRLMLEAQEEYYQIIVKNAKDYDGIIVPESFIESRKREKLSEEVKNTTIPLSMYQSYGRYRERIKLDHLFKFSGIIYYCTEEDEHLVRDAVRFYKIFNNENTLCTYRSYANNKNHFGGIAGKKKTNGKTTGFNQIMFLKLAKGNVQYMKYCRNAHHISDFKSKMVHRHLNMVTNYFQTHNLVDDFECIPDLYTSDLFKSLSPMYSDKINVIKTYVKLLPKDDNNKLDSNKSYLEQYYDLDNIVQTKDQLIIKGLIEEINTLVERNKVTLRYISYGSYQLSNPDDELKEILTKVLDLS